VLLLISLLLAAAPSGHRAKAEHAEALGRMQEAAREYEAAWEEEQAPELLYRLGLARRKLKQYAKAREAFRAYLRVAPSGGLREEVTRQLAKLEVLIEAQAEDYSEPVKPRRPAARVGEQRSPAAREEVNNVHQNPPAATAVVPQPPVIAAAPPAPPPLAAPAPVPAPEPPVPAAAAPTAAVIAPPAPAVPTPGRSRVAPWLAAGAAVAAGAGAYLWWDGARVARDLDARYAAGDLAAADRPLFGRARGESIGGRVLVAAGVGLLAGAVALWW